MSPRGRFIVLEGLDGAGTTSQAERISAALRREGRTVRVTREPSDGPVGVLLRQALTGRVGLPTQQPLTPETLALLFAADRMDHLAAIVAPALERGEIVLCDRYVLSSLAYQGASSPIGWVAELNGRARAADLTLFLEVKSATAARRRAARGGDAELFDDEAKQRRIARGYRDAIRRYGRREKVVVIDGELGIEQVTELALARIQKLLG